MNNLKKFQEDQALVKSNLETLGYKFFKEENEYNSFFYDKSVEKIRFLGNGKVSSTLFRFFAQNRNFLALFDDTIKQSLIFNPIFGITNVNGYAYCFPDEKLVALNHTDKKSYSIFDNNGVSRHTLPDDYEFYLVPILEDNKHLLKNSGKIHILSPSTKKHQLFHLINKTFHEI